MSIDKSETLEGVYEQSNYEKTAEPYTWARLANIIIWKYFFFLAMYHLGSIAALSMYAFGSYSKLLKWRTIVWVSSMDCAQYEILLPCASLALPVVTNVKYVSRANEGALDGTMDQGLYVLGQGNTPASFSRIFDPEPWYSPFLIVGHATCIGTTAGAHRLWTHRSFKAKLPLRILLMILYTTMGLNPLYYWIRDHRVHHKYSETDADPHNAKRGFFFAHIGWLAMKRHPECRQRGKEIDMTDIEADQVVMFQKKHAAALRLLLCFAIPTAVPILLWNETILNAILTQCFIRYVIFMNITLTVNSVAHLWGSRPYNRFINPTENRIVSFFAAGEGSHNYHHTFPWDYKASELPYRNFNTTTFFIDGMAKLGWAYDLREPSRELVEKVIHVIGEKSKVKGLS